MKKFIALILMLTMCVGIMAGCGEEAEAPAAEETEAVSDLAAAEEYLFTMYRKAPSTHAEDFEVVGSVMVGGTSFPIEWTADSDTVQIVPGENGMVTIDVDEKNPEEVLFNLTATLTDAEGATASVTFEEKVPAAIILDAGMSYEEIVEAAYTLEEGLEMSEEYSLFGTVVKIDTPYSEEYKNVTVTIQVGNLADKPVQCFRLSGEGVDKIAEGDEITVHGLLKNYKGTIEFDKGCQFLGMGERIDQSAVLNAAYKLEDGLAMPSPAVLMGVVSSVDTPYSDEYKNVTVTIIVDGKEDQPIQCFRLSGEGAEALAEGDEIAVTGTLKNYKGTIEFDAGCMLLPVESFKSARAVIAGYGLEEGMEMSSSATITGTVISVDTPYSDEYKNVTVTIAVDGMAEQPVQCFRLSGEGAETLAEGSVITVTGTLKNYKGTVEFDAGCTLDAIA